jgi:hypothetical protein
MAGAAEGYAPQQGSAAAGGPASGGSSPGDETASSAAPTVPLEGALLTWDDRLSCSRQSPAWYCGQSPAACQAGCPDCCAPGCRQTKGSASVGACKERHVMQGTEARWRRRRGAVWAATPTWPSHAPRCCTTRADTRRVQLAAGIYAMHMLCQRMLSLPSEVMQIRLVDKRTRCETS